MPYDPQADNAKLMKVYGQEVKTKPELPDEPTRLLRARLVYEEALEFVRACGCNIFEKNQFGDLYNSNPVVEIDEDGTPDLTEYADACGDILVVTYGAMNAAGIRAEPIWNEIQRSNSTKIWPDGTVHKREDGKVVKPPTYSPADVKSVLHRLTNMSNLEMAVELYPELRAATKAGANLWSFMATEAYGAAFRFTYNVVEQAKDIGPIGEYRRPLLARQAVKTILYYYPGPLSARKLAHSLNTSEAVAEELLELFAVRFSAITPPQPQAVASLAA